MMEYEIQKDGKFNYLEVGEGETLMLLHGLFGALSNFSGLIEKFRHTHKVVVPILPLFDLDLLNTSVTGLAKHVEQFIEARGYQNIY
jgi:pimeloyl-ACP methyl ester carboxylesterase